MKHVAGRREPQVRDCFLNLGETEVGKKPTGINPWPRRRGAKAKGLRAGERAPKRRLSGSDVRAAQKTRQRARSEKRRDPSRSRNRRRRLLTAHGRDVREQRVEGLDLYRLPGKQDVESHGSLDRGSGKN